MVVLQIQLRSSNLVIIINALKKMGKFGFEHKYHDLRFLNLIFFSMFLDSLYI